MKIQLKEFDELANSAIALKAMYEELYDDYHALVRKHQLSLDEDGLNWRSCGIIELAVRNPNVDSYMRHWERRATLAEEAVVKMQSEIDELRQWQVDVTCALGRASGTHYADVAGHIKELRDELARTVQALTDARLNARQPNTAPEVLPYERIAETYLLSAIQLRTNEHLLVVQPFGWHLDGKHIPNAAEHFSRESVCEEHRWEVVCDYGPYIAVVRDVVADSGLGKP